jgi:hypothetical protein
MLDYRERNQIKIMLLQLRKRQNALHLFLDGNLGKKGRIDSSRISGEISKKIKQAIVESKWKFIPRGKVAVEMTFFPKGNQFPAIQNLVKYYLDELCGTAFFDDRQVSYLQAKCWNPNNKIKEQTNPAQSKVYIKLERLSDYQRRFDLLFNILRISEFEDYLDERKPYYKDFMSETDFDLDSSFFNEKTKKLLFDIALEDKQKRFLSINKITRFDRPELSKQMILLSSKYKFDLELSPLTIPLGNLPIKGETSAYKNFIRLSLNKFRESYKLIKNLRFSLELDVKVYCKNLTVSKDLDNIMRDIIPIFESEIINSSVYIHAYRIYVVNKNIEGLKSDYLSLKFLPAYSLSEFENKREKIFGKFEEWTERLDIFL